MVVALAGGRRDAEDAPRVTAWKILEGQVMTVTLEHRRLTYTGALTLQPAGCALGRPQAEKHARADVAFKSM